MPFRFISLNSYEHRSVAPLGEGPI